MAHSARRSTGSVAAGLLVLAVHVFAPGPAHASASSRGLHDIVVIPAPTGLLCDWKASPSVGVSASPSFAWVVPHLPRREGDDETDQLQHSYQLQLLAVGGQALLLHDSRRLLTNQSANVVLDGLGTAGLSPGTAYTWRVRVWTSEVDHEDMGSGWAVARFTTALFEGFAAQPIWLASPAATPRVADVDVPRAGVDCDLSGLWKGNGGRQGVPISIASAKGTASKKSAAKNYVAKCSLWTNKLTDLGNGTLVLNHASGKRIAYATPYNSSSAPCTQIKFDNGDDWCKASTCGAAPAPAPAPSPADKGATYAYFRHTEALRGDVASATVFVSANQDGTLEKLLSAYRLYVNGVVVSVGPGRSNAANSAANHTVYDSVDITAALQAVVARDGAAAAVTFAAQCYHHDGGPDAKFMLQAQVAYTQAAEEGSVHDSVHTIVSDSSWLGYHATPIYNPTGGMRGDVSTASTDNQPAENIDASKVLPGWQAASYTPAAAAGWAPVAPRTWVSQPVAKETLPVSFNPGMKPLEMTQMAPGHWFVDFGTEIMAGLTLKVQGGKAGSLVNVKLSEELMCRGCVGPAGHGGPGKGKGCNTCLFNETTKKILYPMRTGNTYQETYTLQAGTSEIENHEYKLFRWGEITVADPPAGMSLDLSAWVVRYPWSEADGDLGTFNSSNPMLNRVWELCVNTVKVTSLDTTTDSNTREKLPYEADGYITGGTRHSTQRDSTWQRHSSKHNIRNPTWPTEWRQIMSLMAYEDYMATGSTSIATELYDTILANTMINCVNKHTHLVDFSKAAGSCSRAPKGDPGHGGVRDITDWPTDARDGFQMTDISVVINAYFVTSMQAMATLAGAMGKSADQARFSALGAATAAAIRTNMMDSATGLFTDTVASSPAHQKHSAWHSQIFAMWAGVVEEGDAGFPTLIAFLKSKAKNTGVTGSVYAAYAYYLALYMADYDHGAFALEMLTTCENNGYCHMLMQGATATMEAWTREEKDNLSWSHPWASAPGTAIPRGFMGIVATQPAFKRFTVKPQPGDVEEAQITLPTIAGPIKASFIQVKSPHGNAALTLTLSPPANTLAKVCLPKLGPRACTTAQPCTLTVDGKKAVATAQGDYLCVDNIGSAATARVISPNQ